MGSEPGFQGPRAQAPGLRAWGALPRVSGCPPFSWGVLLSAPKAPQAVTAPLLAQLGSVRGAAQSLTRKQGTVGKPTQKIKTVELLGPLFTSC